MTHKPGNILLVMEEGARVTHFGAEEPLYKSLAAEQLHSL